MDFSKLTWDSFEKPIADLFFEKLKELEARVNDETIPKVTKLAALMIDFVRRKAAGEDVAGDSLIIAEGVALGIAANFTARQGAEFWGFVLQVLNITTGILVGALKTA